MSFFVRPCGICGSDEPFHVHDGDKVIKDYFLIGRYTADIEAAREWQRRALEAERKLADAAT